MHPESVLKGMMKHLGVEYDKKQLDKSKYSNDQRAKLQEFRRLNQDISDLSVGRYKKELTINEINIFNRISSKYLKFYGYDVA